MAHPREIERCLVDIFDVPLGQLNAIIQAPYSQELVDAECNHCKATLTCERIKSPFIACDSCIEKHLEAEKDGRQKKYWEHVCPERFRSTDQTFKDWPAAIWRTVRTEQNANPKRSFFLYGPTGTCKTRMGMLLLKYALRDDRRVGVLWPEKLRTLSQGFDNSAFDRYAEYDVLLLDDVLLTAVRESKLMDALKQLIDVRMRHERPFIITSQIGSEDDLKDGKEFGDAKAADVERIKALLRRLREDCLVVPFAQPKPAEGVQAF